MGRGKINFFGVLDQRGPTTFDLRAILQKRDNSHVTSTEMMYCIKQLIHNIQN